MSRQAELQRSRRKLFAAPGSGHDRLVGLLRVALPSAVGALLAILLVAPLAQRNEISFVLDKNEVDKAEERLKVSDALYRGQDDQGRPFSLRAGSAVQRSAREAMVELADLDARILLDDGPATLRAGRGLYDIGAQTIDVIGPVQFEAERGYRLTTRDVLVSLNDKSLRSRGPVSGSTGFGTFSGGRLTGNLDTRLITVEGGVTGRTRLGTFSANEMTADLAARTVTLAGNAKVRVKQGGLR